MDIVLHTDKNINTDDVDAIFEEIGWGKMRSKETWAKVLEKSSFVVYATIGNEVVGFGRCLDDTDMCMIYDIVVHPKYQNHSIGTMLMNKIMEYIKQNNFIRVQLFANDKEAYLSDFYHKFGFENVKTGMSFVGLGKMLS